jgi:hypothetical protein
LSIRFNLYGNCYNFQSPSARRHEAYTGSNSQSSLAPRQALLSAIGYRLFLSPTATTFGIFNNAALRHRAGKRRRQFRQSPVWSGRGRPRTRGVHDALTVTPPRAWRDARAPGARIDCLRQICRFDARRPHTQGAREQCCSSLSTDVSLKPARPAHLDVRIATSRSRSPPRRYRAQPPAAHPMDGSAASPQRPPAEWRR